MEESVVYLYVGFNFSPKLLKVLDDGGMYRTTKVCMLVCYDASFISYIIVYVLQRIGT